jgi:hypothetical protein
LKHQLARCVNNVVDISLVAVIQPFPEFKRTALNFWLSALVRRFPRPFEIGGLPTD